MHNPTCQIFIKLIHTTTGCIAWSLPLVTCNL